MPPVEQVIILMSWQGVISIANIGVYKTQSQIFVKCDVGVSATSSVIILSFHHTNRMFFVLTFENVQKASRSHCDIHRWFTFNSFRHIFRMSNFLENLKSHWSSLGLIDLLVLVYIFLLALFIFAANRLFVGKFLDTVASLAPFPGWSVRSQPGSQPLLLSKPIGETGFT